MAIDTDTPASRWQFCLSELDRTALRHIELTRRESLKREDGRSSMSAAFRHAISSVASAKRSLANVKADSPEAIIRSSCREVSKGKAGSAASSPLLFKWCVWLRAEHHEYIASIMKKWVFEFESEAARFAIRMTAAQEGFAQ